MSVEYGHETNHACEHGKFTAEEYCEKCEKPMKIPYRVEIKTSTGWQPSILVATLFTSRKEAQIVAEWLGNSGASDYRVRRLVVARRK